MLKRTLLLPVILLCGIAFGVWAAGAKVMSVQVKQSELRASPSGLAGVVATVKLGDPLTLIEEKGAWTRVSLGDKTGWIPTSSLVKGELKIKAGSKDAQLAASSDEMATATKGFNSDVESKFKQNDKDMDFTWVDRMEKFKVSLNEIRAFMKQGKLDIEKGGVP